MQFFLSFHSKKQILNPYWKNKEQDHLTLASKEWIIFNWRRKKILTAKSKKQKSRTHSGKFCLNCLNPFQINPHQSLNVRCHNCSTCCVWYVLFGNHFLNFYLAVVQSWSSSVWFTGLKKMDFVQVWWDVEEKQTEEGNLICSDHSRSGLKQPTDSNW